MYPPASAHQLLNAHTTLHTTPRSSGRLFLFSYLLKHSQAAARPESAIINDFMHLSLVRRELPRWGSQTKQFAEMYRRGVALTLNLENENCLQGAIRALVEQQALLDKAAGGV